MSPTITSIARVSLCLWSVLWLFGSAPVRGQSLSRTLLEEGIPSLAKAAREKGDPVRGAIWFSQKKLNCVKCHQAGATDLLGPDLNRLGRDVTDEYLVESLLAPSAVIKKGYEAIKVLTEDGTVVIGRLLQEGPERIIIRDNSDRSIQRTLARESIEFMEPSDVSTMPSDLSDQLADRQQFLDLARYLMDLAASSSTDAVAADVSGGGEVSERLKGIALIDQYRCVRCHAGPTGSILPPATGPKLNEVSGRLDPEFLQRFLGDPAHTQPGTMMPNVLASLPDASRDQVTRSVVAFLRSRSDQTFQRTAVDQQAADRGRETFHSVGCVACHSPRDDSGRELLSDSSVPLGELASKYSVSSLTQFLEKPHEVRPSGRMPDMKLTHWEAVDIANYLAGGPPESDAASSDVAAGLAAAGRTFYFSLGCANCHESDVEASPFKDLASLNADRGCLSADSDRKVRYDFSDQQRRLIRIALEQLADPLGKQAELNLAMHTLRCFNCHQRSGLGGVRKVAFRRR